MCLAPAVHPYYLGNLHPVHRSRACCPPTLTSSSRSTSARPHLRPPPRQWTGLTTCTGCTAHWRGVCGAWTSSSPPPTSLLLAWWDGLGAGSSCASCGSTPRTAECSSTLTGIGRLLPLMMNQRRWTTQKFHTLPFLRCATCVYASVGISSPCCQTAAAAVPGAQHNCPFSPWEPACGFHRGKGVLITSRASLHACPLPGNQFPHPLSHPTRTPPPACTCPLCCLRTMRQRSRLEQYNMP